MNNFEFRLACAVYLDLDCAGRLFRIYLQELIGDAACQQRLAYGFPEFVFSDATGNYCTISKQMRAVSEVRGSAAELPP
jgi:hypothetical protein